MKANITESVKAIAKLIADGERPGSAVNIVYEESGLDLIIEKAILIEEFEKKYKCRPYDYKLKISNTSVSLAINEKPKDDDEDDDIEMESDVLDVIGRGYNGDIYRELDIEIEEDE